MWMNTITGRMANIANNTFPQGVGRGFQTIDRQPLGVAGVAPAGGILGGIGRALSGTSGLPAGTTLPTGSTAGRTGGGGGLFGNIASMVPGLLGSSGPQAPTPGFQPRVPTPGGAGMGSSGAPGTLPTNTNAPPQGLMAALQGIMGGGAGASPGAAVGGGIGGAIGRMMGPGGTMPTPTSIGSVMGVPGFAGGGLASLIAALQNANSGGPGQQSHGTPT